MMTESHAACSAAVRYRMSIPTDPIPNDPPLEPPYNPDPHPIDDPPPHLL